MGLFTKKFTLVVVCTANITRSAYLHGYMENYLKQSMPYARKKIKIRSAGVRARSGSSAHRVVKHVAKLNGFNLESHHSDPLTRKTIKTADAILVMEQWQKDDILERFPQAREKTFRMMEYLWQGDPSDISDIPDPTGKNTVDYEEFIPIAHAEVDRILRELANQGII
jgi:protein-tyrosine phosphatase